MEDKIKELVRDYCSQGIRIKSEIETRIKVIVENTLASYKKKLVEEIEEFMDKQIGDANSRDAYGGTGKETAKIIKDDLKQFINLTK